MKCVGEQLFVVTEVVGISGVSCAYGTQQLLDDLARFIFLLGGSDGEPLFNPERQ